MKRVLRIVFLKWFPIIPNSDKSLMPDVTVSSSMLHPPVSVCVNSAGQCRLQRSITSIQVVRALGLWHIGNSQ